jgi:hypothetical protein
MFIYLFKKIRKLVFPDSESDFEFAVAFHGWEHRMGQFRSWQAAERIREERRPVESWFRERLTRLNPLTPKSKK